MGKGFNLLATPTKFLIKKANTRSVQGKFFAVIGLSLVVSPVYETLHNAGNDREDTIAFAATLRNVAAAKACPGGAIPSNILDLLKA